MENDKQESVLVEFEYNGHEISFSLGSENIMVNATEMAKPFGKRVKDWLKTDSVNEFIQVLENQQRENNPTADNQLIRVVNGGLSKRGTWIHEDLALVFAQWLHPEFYLWCNRHIKELLLKGYTKLDSVPNQQVIEDLRRQQEEDRPKVLFAEAVRTSPDSCTIEELAKSISQNNVSVGRNKLYAWMRNNRYLARQGNSKNLPMQRFINQGIFKIETYIYDDKQGKTRSGIRTTITGKGQIYFVNRFLANEKTRS